MVIICDSCAHRHEACPAADLKGKPQPACMFYKRDSMSLSYWLKWKYRIIKDKVKYGR